MAFDLPCLELLLADVIEVLALEARRRVVGQVRSQVSVSLRRLQQQRLDEQRQRRVVDVGHVTVMLIALEQRHFLAYPRNVLLVRFAVGILPKLQCIQLVRAQHNVAAIKHQRLSCEWIRYVQQPIEAWQHQQQYARPEVKQYLCQT